MNIGGYTILGELGRGGMGVVLHGHDPIIGRPVAVKVIKVESGTLGGPAQASEALRRFFNEARSAGRLSHPSIVTIYHIGQEQDFSYIVMEYVDGPSLLKLIGPPGRLTAGEILRILGETADALDYAHSMNVVHRDVKPANILLNSRGAVKVCDFGIARIYGEAASATGAVIGTPHYMSPEQIQGKRVDGRSDAYSLAVAAYEMIAGTQPFAADSFVTLLYKIVSEPAPGVHTVNPAIPRAVSAVLEKGMAKAPEQRFGTCREFVQALREAWGPAAAAAPVEERAAAKSRGGRPAGPAWVAAAAAAGLAVVLVSGFGLHYWWSGRQQAALPAPAAEAAREPRAAPPPSTPAVTAKQQAPASGGREAPAARPAAAEQKPAAAAPSVAAVQKQEAQRTPGAVEAPAQGEAEWQSIRLSARIEDHRSYLERYPSSRHAGEAAERIRELEAWEAVRGSDRAEDLREYARSFPGSLRAADAARRAAALESARKAEPPPPAQVQPQAASPAAEPKAQPPALPAAAPAAVTPAKEAPASSRAELEASARQAAAEAVKQFQRGRYEQAAELYGKAAGLTPTTAEYFAEQGKVYLKMGKFAPAVESLSRALHLRPEDAFLLTLRGYAYYNLAEHKRAVEDFSQAIRLKPDLREAYLSRGNSKWAMGDRAGAEADFKMARALAGRR